MKIFSFLMISFLITGIGGCSDKTPKLDVDDDKRINMVQRDTKIINGNQEKIELKLGDITYGHVSIDISGQKSNTQFLHLTMYEGERQIFDYYGTKYLFNVLHFENHVVHDDKAEISFRKLTNQEAENLKRIIDKEASLHTDSTQLNHINN